MSEKTLFRGARLVDPAGGHDGVADVLVEGERIAAVGEEASGSAAGARVVECDGLVMAPGLVDMHTHLREPGREDKETVETGCRAAAVGGFTAVAPMANTDPDWLMVLGMEIDDTLPGSHTFGVESPSATTRYGGPGTTVIEAMSLTLLPEVRSV